MTEPAPTLIAIYDMDKTVTRRATYTPFLLFMARRNAPWRLLMAPALLFGFALYGLRIWKREPLKEYMQKLLLGGKVSKQSLAVSLEGHAAWVCDTNIYPQALARIAEEKQQGYIHVLATASYDLYVDAIAKRIGFDHVIGTKLFGDNCGNVLAKIDGENCYFNAKLGRIKAWMLAQKLDRKTCAIRAYSDHVSDEPMLNFADEAIATNPHKPLEQLARGRGWPILDWRAGDVQT
jgi:HAD superfamily hydrolase (TIGR01490 family)